MKIFCRSLTITFVFFLITVLVVPVSFGQDNSAISVIDTNHKCAPKRYKSAAKRKKPSLAKPLQVVKSSHAKRKPSTRSYTTTSVFRKRITARSAIVMDAHSGKILYAKSPDKPGQPASTIKVLTTLVALKNMNKHELVPVSRRAASMPRSKIYLDRKKSYKANDLINAVILASANDASVAIAERVAGSEKEFAKLMTEKARELGARNTICKTASGLTARGQHSTARDLALIFNEAMEDEVFAAKVRRRKTRTSYGKILRNHNKALWRIVGAQGGKTGYTRAARQTYVGKFKRGDNELVVAIMGSGTMWDDISKLVEYGFKRKHSTMVAQNTSTKSSRQNHDRVVLRARNVLSGTKKVSKM